LFAGQALCKGAEDGRRERDAQRSGGDGHACGGLRCVKKVREQRQQGLGAVELKKGADAAESYGDRSSCAGR
jgi:hypothetical protein